MSTTSFCEHWGDSLLTVGRLSRTLIPMVPAQLARGRPRNWSQQYKTAAETRPGLSRSASDYGVLALQAGAVRKVASFFAVEHTPRDHNRAHTDVWGLDKFHLNGDEAMKLADARLELAEIARIVIDP